MAKTNFSKAEESLRVAMEKMQIKQLGKQADIAQGAVKAELKSLMEKAAKVAAKTAIERKATLHVILRAVKEQGTPQFYNHIGCTREELSELLTPGKELKREDWDKLKGIKEKILILKREHKGTTDANEDENLVELERKRHVNKRFNIREKWLPMK